MRQDVCRSSSGHHPRQEIISLERTCESRARSAGSVAILRATTAHKTEMQTRNSRRYPFRFWFNSARGDLVAEQISQRFLVACGSIAEGPRFRKDGHLGRVVGMYEWVYCPLRRGDSGLVAPEPSIGGIPRGDRLSHFRKWKLVLVLFGCALFCFACADDSTADNTEHRHHRHGNGHGRDQTESVDRSNNPSPTPALGW